MLRFLVVDHHDIVCQGLKDILIKGYRNAKVTTLYNGRDAVAEVRCADWDAVLMDISLPGRGGLDVLQDIKKIKPEIPVLILSAHSEKQYALRALKLGASGYLSKDHTVQEIIPAIEKILAGGQYVSSLLVQEVVRNVTPYTKSTPQSGEPLHNQLADRERQVLCHLAEGARISDVAELMGISVSAASTYRSRLMKKLGVASTAELIRYAVDRGLRL